MMKTATWLEQIQLRRPEIFDGSFKAISQRKENSEFIRLDKDAFIVVSDCYEVTGGQKKKNSLLD